MTDGVLIARKIGDEVESIHLDQETIEFARQNARVKSRLSQTALMQEETNRRNAAENAAKARRAEKYRRVRNRMIQNNSSLMIVAAAVAGAAYLDLMNPTLAVAIAAGCVTAVHISIRQWLVQTKKEK